MKLIFALFIALFTLFLVTSRSFASENFDIFADVTYEVDSDEPTKVIQEISILNKKEFIFSPTYSISFGFENMGNIQVYNQSGSIPFDYNTDRGIVTLDINFVNPPKGINTTNNFTISFETDEVVEKKGDIVEVDIPGISDPDSFLEYNTKVLVPDTFNQVSLIKPDIKEATDNLEFTKEDTRGAGIVMIFGDAQYYRFDLKYNISNPNLFPIVTEIALPANTNYQEVLIDKISEDPNSVEEDVDGNWIAKFTLLPREKKTIEASVLVKVFSEPKRVKLSDKERELYTSPQKYWEISDPQIKKIVSELKSARAVYSYVVENLTYDFDKVSSENERLGGVGTLENPANAVCLEFSDLFVTLARSAGIPARTIEGYAYTRNSKLRPLSLADDILHAWPEYYDFEKGTWIMVDPTWGNTTRGIDYFNSFDLDHVAFVTKGSESIYPIPAGGYKFENGSKDIDVSFLSEKDFQERKSLTIDDSFSKFSFAGVPISGFVTVENSGNTFVKEKLVTITNTSTGEEKEYTIKNLPPFGSESFNVTFDTSFLTNSTHQITIQIDDVKKSVDVNVSFIPDLNLILIGGGIFVASGIFAFVAVKTGRIYLQRRKK